MEKYFLILGSNAGEPFTNITRALEEIGVVCTIEKCSSYYLTEPVGRSGSPWFVNVAVSVSTHMEPPELLAVAKKIEEKLGRRFSSNNLPRTIDIDIASGTKLWEEMHLQVPHRGLAERKFMLIPIHEIAPEEPLGFGGKNARELLEMCEDSSMVVRI